MTDKEIKVYTDKMTAYIKDVKVGNNFNFLIEMKDGEKAYVSGHLVKKFPVRRYYLRVTADHYGNMKDYRLIKENASKKEVSTVLTDLLNSLNYNI